MQSKRMMKNSISSIVHMIESSKYIFQGKLHNDSLCRVDIDPDERRKACLQ